MIPSSHVSSWISPSILIQQACYTQPLLTASTLLDIAKDALRSRHRTTWTTKYAMSPFLKLLCGGSAEDDAPGPRPSYRVPAAASEQTIYTHLTTLFEDNEGLYSFITKFRHDGRRPRNSVRDYLVPALNVVSYKRVELLHHSLPPRYRTSLVRRIHLYDDRKPLFAHLTTVFREERALFSFYLEFQGRNRGSSREIEDRHPQLDEIIYAKEMDPLVTNLAGNRVLSWMSSVQYRSRSQRATANYRSSDNRTSATLGKRVPTARSSEPTRRWYSEAALPTQRPALDRSISTAAARTTLYGSDRSQRAVRSSETEQRPVESVSYLDGTPRARESYRLAKTTQHVGNPNRDIVCASTEAHVEQETRSRSSPDQRNRINRLERHSSTDLGREYIEHQAPERISWHPDPESLEAADDHISHTTDERTRSRSRMRSSQRSNQPQEQRRSANTDTLGGRPAVFDAPTRNIMSPRAELLHNPFAESPPRLVLSETPPAHRERIERPHDSVQCRTLPRRHSVSSTDSYERPCPRTALPQASILARSPRAEPRERGSHHVHFDLSDDSTEYHNRGYENTSPRPTYGSPFDRDRGSYPPPPALSQPSRQIAPTPTTPATFENCKRCKTMPLGIDMKGYCSHCWLHVDPAEKLLCEECYRTFTAPHEDSREILTMCKACYEVVPGVQRERERLRALGIGYD